MGTSNNVRGHKFGLGPVFDCLPGLLFPPIASVGTLQTTPPSSCRGEPFQRHQAADVVGQILQADLGARPHDANRSHDPTAWRVLLRSDDRWLRADRPSLTRLASVYRHRKIPADPSSPLRIKISRIRFAQLGRSGYFSRCPAVIQAVTPINLGNLMRS